MLVRHGESVWVAEGRFQGRRDPALSALGERQAELVGRRLAQPNDGTPLPIPAGLPIGLWHSPLRRAADTAHAIARLQPAEVPLVPAPGLIELAQGEWEGLLHSEVRARWPEQLARWRSAPTEAHAPGGEPLLSAAVRVRSTLGDIFTALAAEPAASDDPAAQPWAVIVAHDGIFRLALMALLEVPYERFWSFPFNLCAISVITLHEGAAALRAHNLSEHLTPLTIDERAAAEARGDRRGAL